MLAEAADGCLLRRAHAASMRETARARRRAARRADGAAWPRASSPAIALGMALVLGRRGRGRRGRDPARALALLDEASDELLDDPRLLAWAAMGPLFLRESGAGPRPARPGASSRRSAARRSARCRCCSSTSRATIARPTEHWAAAEACYDEAIRLARETGQRGTTRRAPRRAWPWLEARQGREEACRAHADEAARLCDELGIGFYALLGARRRSASSSSASAAPEAAVAALRGARGAPAALEIGDVDLSPAPELVDVELRARPARARGRPARRPRGGGPTPRASPGRWPARPAAAGCWPPTTRSRTASTRRWRCTTRTPDAFETAARCWPTARRLRRLRQRVRAREVLARGARPVRGPRRGRWADQARGRAGRHGRHRPPPRRRARSTR